MHYIYDDARTLYASYYMLLAMMALNEEEDLG